MDHICQKGNGVLCGKIIGEYGDAWGYMTHEKARYTAYRWGEDGIAGLADHKQNFCFALAFWNEKDPILKERLFGLSNPEGKSWRRCERVILLPGFHSHAFLHENAV